MTIGRRKSAQTGLAAVEFTVALPLLLFLLLAVSEFGRAFLQYTTLTHAVRDGVRLAASQAMLGQSGSVSLDAALVTSVRNLVVYGNTAGTGTALLPGFVPANVTVSDLGGGNIAVMAAYRYQPMIGTAIPKLVSSGSIATTFTLTAQVVTRAIS
jgi:Flp pilus assembly protein TadG